MIDYGIYIFTHTPTGEQYLLHNTVPLPTVEHYLQLNLLSKTEFARLYRQNPLNFPPPVLLSTKQCRSYKKPLLNHSPAVAQKLRLKNALALTKRLQKLKRKQALLLQEIQSLEIEIKLKLN